MQECMPPGGWLSKLLPGVLLIVALPFGPASASSRAAKLAQDQPSGLSQSGSDSRAPGWDAASGPTGLTQILVQNQSPHAAAPDKSQTPDEEELDLNDQVIRDVFGPLQRGMQSHNLYQVLAIFDQQGTPDYAQIRDQLRAFFYQYDEIRFRYRLLQVTSDKEHASAVAEVQMDATPADPSQVTLRRETQMRFRMNLDPKGWRLVGFSPTDFFPQ